MYVKLTRHCGSARWQRRGSGKTLLARLRRWLVAGAVEERYLAAATDHADLEHRMRDLERANRGPVFATFNH